MKREKIIQIAKDMKLWVNDEYFDLSCPDQPYGLCEDDLLLFANAIIEAYEAGGRVEEVKTGMAIMFEENERKWQQKMSNLSPGERRKEIEKLFEQMDGRYFLHQAYAKRIKNELK